MLLTVVLTAGLGYVISKIEREKIMSNWNNRRCQVPIMAMGSYFKPKDDPRTPGQFAKDNFTFCMDSIVKTVTSQVMTPLGNVFSSHTQSAGILQQALNAIRVIIKKIYDAFMEYIDDFLRKYNNIAQQVRTVTLHLKAAFGRVNAMMMSMVYIGLTTIRGMMNTLDFVFKVVLIILGIMVALIILLWFVLFPFIPIVLSVIGAIMAVAIGTMAGTAESYKSAFCFAPGTSIALDNGKCIPIKDVKIGDTLINGIKVDSIMKMSGKGAQLWYIDGIYVTGTHLIETGSGTNRWHPVEQDPRAKKTCYIEGYVYCLNTSSHTIPVCTSNDKLLYFRDWEELDDIDIDGHQEWNANVFQFLNANKPQSEWLNSIGGSLEYPCVSSSTKIKTPDGNRNISEIQVGDMVYDQCMNPTEVLGVICTTTHIPKTVQNDNEWVTNMIYLDGGIWRRINYSTQQLINATGINIITAEGTFIAKYAENEVIYRDFTEVGCDQIEDTNTCVEARLRP